MKLRIIFFAFGVLLAAGAANVLYRSYVVSKWPTANGVIMSTAIQRSRGGSSTSYYPTIKYRYAVGGQTYYSAKYDANHQNFSYGMAQQIVKNNPAGAPVLVLYNPSNPADAVITSDVEFSWIVLLLAGLGLCGLGAFGSFLNITKPQAGTISSSTDAPVQTWNISR